MPEYRLIYAHEIPIAGKLHEDLQAWNSMELFITLETSAKKSVAPLILLGKIKVLLINM